ncbi:MAG: hypothetical protein J0I47_14460 [Sphingomonas sp.]|uniref:hypothetical protein n=1 Tax=Sphingomonas sp. TaxID=28214 RepID=UPI001AC342C2|nr:hypothetical protein [Sphingomonas sp.]MBN8809420.1 hypothetical protein [Sphingomonas sp.]
MRKLALFLAAATVAAPAFARDHDAPPPPRDDLRAVSHLLSDPRAQAGIAGLVDALTDAVMQTRVGPLADLAPDSDLRPGDTLGDVQRRRDPAYRQRLRAETAGAMAVLGRATGDAAAMSDELRATVARVQRVIEPYQR